MLAPSFRSAAAAPIALLFSFAAPAVSADTQNPIEISRMERAL